MNPAFGDGQVEEYVVLGRFGVEGVVECLLCNGLLLVDELSADFEFVCQLGDGCGASECLDSQFLALGWGEGFGRAWLRTVGVGRGGRMRKKTHACFLHELG